MTNPTCIRRPHGTWTSCRCPDCHPIRLRMAKLARNGIRPPRRSDEAWAEVDRLTELGWTPRAIASASGLSERTIRGAMVRRDEGHLSTWTSSVSEAIIRHAPWPTVGHVSAIGSMRRLQGLTALGWTLDALAAESGLPITTLSVVRAGRTRQIHAGTRSAIDSLYERLSFTTGASDVARAIASKQRWAPPLAWDEAAIDDPGAVPSGVGYTAGRHRTRESIVDLRDAGLTDRQIAERLALTIDAIQAADRRAAA